MKVEILDLGPDRVIAISDDVLMNCPDFSFTKRMANLNLNNLLDVMLVRIERFDGWGLWVNIMNKKEFVKVYKMPLFEDLRLILDKIYACRVEGDIAVIKIKDELRLNIPASISLTFSDTLEGSLRVFRDGMVTWVRKFIDSLCNQK